MDILTLLISRVNDVLWTLYFDHHAVRMCIFGLLLKQISYNSA